MPALLAHGQQPSGPPDGSPVSTRQTCAARLLSERLERTHQAKANKATTPRLELGRVEPPAVRHPHPSPPSGDPVSAPAMPPIAPASCPPVLDVLPPVDVPAPPRPPFEVSFSL